MELFNWAASCAADPVCMVLLPPFTILGLALVWVSAAVICAAFRSALYIIKTAVTGWLSTLGLKRLKKHSAPKRRYWN